MRRRLILWIRTSEDREQRLAAEGASRGVWYNSRVKAPGLPVIDRYLIRELISPFCFGGALFTFFLVIDRIYQLTDLVITKGVPFHLVLQLLGFMLPSFLPHAAHGAAGGRAAG